MTHPIRFALLTAALIGAPALAMAEPSQADRTFVEKAATGGHAEVSAGETAAKSDNAAVAAFGREMVADHTKMNDELATLARGIGVTPPESASLMQQAKNAVTGVLPGSTFDRTYAQEQVTAHKETLALLQGEASGGTDPQIKAFAAKYIPIVEQHLAAAEKLQQQLAAE